MIALQGTPCHRARLHVPRQGRWLATVALDGTAPTGRVTLQWGNASLLGGVVARDTGAWQGEAIVTIVGGPGWSTVLPAQWHQNDAGLTGQAIAHQVAALAGETLSAPATAFRSLRTSYSRTRREAAATLADVLAKDALWWVEFDGVTRAGTRTSQNTPARVEVLSYDPGASWADLDADDVGQTLIGAVISASPPRRPHAFRIVELMAEIGERGQKLRASVEAA